VGGGWRTLHNEFRSLYTTVNIVMVISARRMK